MEYKILEHHSPNGLAGDVSFHLKQGWKLHGNLFVHDNKFYQSIFKDK
ncbi:DUF1737 domain-containing protein [Chryseobacterium sp. RP-3-3]|uniref:DUF1737 domain-containing protein n=1 Tax=Chryseobacterium antibioticum TaxID=2728847 RepID=A0A7Y0FRB4_9FLAO|nr:DUF1737 domain-containing protein [Chryseobacterium antibioticum]